MTEVTRHDANGGVSLTVLSRSPDQEFHPAVVLLPGTGATATDWAEIAADLSRDRAVHAVDLRGHGQSQWPGVYSIDLMAADLMDLLSGLGGQVDLIGHSLGGLVACRTIAFGAFEPRRLVLEDVGMLHARSPALPARPDGELDFDWGVVEQIRPEIDDPAPHWRDTLTRIPIPTLTIGGGPASFLPQEHVAELASLVQRGRHMTIGAGHSIHATKSAEFLDAVRQFLDA